MHLGLLDTLRDLNVPKKGLLMVNEKTPSEWAQELRQQLRDHRLRQNVDQRKLARLNVVKNLAAGKGTTVTSMVMVLRALGRVDWLASLAPAVSISPLQMLKARHSRQRASKGKADRV